MLKLSKNTARRLRRLNKRLPKKKIYLYLAALTAFASIVWWVDVVLYAPNHPSSTNAYYRSLDLSEARQATYSNKPIETIKDLGKRNSVKRHLISFDVPKDGLTEYGLMTLPTTGAPLSSKYPVIILCHGYSDPQAYSTLESYIDDMTFYSQHGFAVIKPDYRGNGFSLTAGTPDGAYYSMSYNTDVMSLIAAIKKTPYLDAGKISIWGHSMGGYVALRAAVLSQDIKNVILLSAPVGTPQDMYSGYTAVSDTENPTAQEIRNIQLALHGTPLSNPGFWNKTSPLTYLAKGDKRHFQIYVGSKDEIVPPKFSADLNKVLSADKIAHDYVVYKGAFHGLGRQRPSVWQRSLPVLKR